MQHGKQINLIQLEKLYETCGAKRQILHEGL